MHRKFGDFSKIFLSSRIFEKKIQNFFFFCTSAKFHTNKKKKGWTFDIGDKITTKEDTYYNMPTSETRQHLRCKEDKLRL